MPKQPIRTTDIGAYETIKPLENTALQQTGQRRATGMAVFPHLEVM
jgi:hypothetical protein